MTDLKLDIKNMIIDALELEDISPDEIIDSDPLFVDGLGLDSIDALEIGLALQKKYGIKLKADSKETHEHFASVNALAALVESYKEKN
ncbi:acyl carrier protein [Marinomonas primoryensis]|jgi:acyl carrier protein|uniref:Acyl carrier protein n=1 Tax=Marinomonas primoryensis TaxID=178399 RepID=A0A2Z4PPU1_9GAMM|nr:phosphopantetheine-binding protein [Marinomonas primoryensis]AWX99607.1 acyl carrier protein [Marinomonas primoryensis]QKK79240.1 phosphopantetheine attachment site superfamily protein [Marinomonas primoryensis]|tara:strand:+ start:1838 stop:2101 length:264 start_codon:yes stop_codon:yes gene_type:complete